MKKLRWALAAAVVAGLSMLAPSAAQAQGDDPYQEVTVHVSERTVVGGNDITIEAEIDPSDIDCDWSLTFMGETRTGSGSSITETFSTPEVDEVEEHEAVATCTFNPTVTGTGTQTLTPEDDDDDDGDDDGDGDGDGDGDDGGLLPNTGGERLAWLLIGILLILVGGGVVMASRRRDA
jgi:LPXTG-motif cell wall-anchored protein